MTAVCNGDVQATKVLFQESSSEAVQDILVVSIYFTTIVKLKFLNGLHAVDKRCIASCYKSRSFSNGKISLGSWSKSGRYR